MLGAAVVAAPAAEAHRLWGRKAKRAIRSSLGNSSIAVGGDSHGQVLSAEPPPSPEAWSRAERVALALDYLAVRDDDDLEDLLFDSVRRCWPNWSHGQ